jgi:acyl-CoA synthetase (AMP-forming)/AMP-acid ligase II
VIVILTVMKGDTLLLMSPNCPEWAVWFHGVLALGAAVSPVNPTFTADDLVHQAALANATVLLADSVPFNVEMSTKRIDHARANFIAT